MVDPLGELPDRPHGKTRPFGFARKMPICIVALLGIVGPATTFVARRASEHFSCQTQSPGEFFNSLLGRALIRLTDGVN
ncbi:MAG: hypothetical protein BWY57_01507 [Betaproteobacteria bacterium ADurb.Bin341]|nr:MAG: hypothetical protein BWY57_01507 [Betaproteobacteria bacterium ADurb.Bin341]